MKKDSYVVHIFNWFYLHRKPVAIILVSVMVLSIALNTSVIRQSGDQKKSNEVQTSYKITEDTVSAAALANDVSVHMDRFLDAVAKEDYSSALEAISYIIEHDTADDISKADYYLKRGSTYVLMEKYDEAMDDLNQSLLFNDQQADAYTLKGQIYMMKENYTEALDLFEHAIQLSEDSPEIFYNKAVCHIMTGKYEEAAGELEYVLQSDCDTSLKDDCRQLLDTISDGYYEM